MSIFTPMIDERMFDLLRSQLSSLHEEKAFLLAQVNSLTQEIGILRSSLLNENKGLKEMIASLIKKVELLTNALKEKDALIAHLQEIIANNNVQLAQSRKKKFGRTTEQKRLLNNQSIDHRANEKDGFDGTPGSLSDSSEDNQTAAQEPAASSSRKRCQSARESESHHVDQTIHHSLESYYELPEGGHFLTRNGEIDKTLYRFIEYLPARIIEHVYEVARVALKDHTIVSTMETPYTVDRCPFSAELLAFILCEKYAYHSSINTVKKKLRDMGAIFSKSTLNRYYQKSIGALMDTLEETLQEEVRQTDYLMIDETCELVGVVDRQTGEKAYKKKYLWAFFAKLKNLVSYVYEQGSRSRQVVTDFLKGFCGFISTDGYVAYSVFDDAEKYPEITRAGCWTHVRRLFVDSLPSQREASMEMINEIGYLFEVELNAKICGLSDLERKQNRQKLSVPIMTRLYARAKTMSKDLALMANDLMRKAVNYLLNQWDSLRNYILDGKVQISNNLVEQRMKTIKLDLKNCQNIGSEDAARKAAFMHSMFESCSLNKIRPLDYFTNLFRCYKELDDPGKVAILPCYYQKNT